MKRCLIAMFLLVIVVSACGNEVPEESSEVSVTTEEAITQDEDTPLWNRKITDTYYDEDLQKNKPEVWARLQEILEANREAGVISGDLSEYHFTGDITIDADGNNACYTIRHSDKLYAAYIESGEFFEVDGTN